MEFIRFFEGLNIILQAIVIAMFVVLFAAMLFWFFTVHKKTLTQKEEFHEVLENALKTGTINDSEDIINLYKGVTGYSLPNEHYREKINFLLRSFLANLHSKSKKLEAEEIKKWKNVITEYIKENEELSPFSNLPDAERSIMNDILDFLKADDEISSKAKLKELAGYIQSKTEFIKDLQKKNKVATIIAWVGIILTIFFGFLK